jgi:hypothetical protein
VLLSFRVSNHKSIRDEQTLHMQPVYDKSRPALPVAAIFGANAAGKSNILDAFSFAVRAVRESFSSWTDGIPRTPFRLAPGYTARESTFTLEMLVDGVRYLYSFSVNDERVTEEWLYAYPHQRKRLVFERTGNDVKVGRDTKHRAQVDLLKDLMPPTALFLSVAARSDLTDVRSVYKWFGRIEFASPAPDDADEDQILRAMSNNLAIEQRLRDLAQAADLGNTGITYHFSMPDTVAQQITQADGLAGIQKILESAEGVERRLVFTYGPYKLGWLDQSQGTRIWLKYLLCTLWALDNGAVLVIDEIDSSLHPHLSAQLVRMFHDTKTNPHNSQLIFTTHDATLLGRQFGEDILARDEIWFVEKGQDCATSIYALADFKPRKDENTERRYLTGSYGGIPALFEGDFTDAVDVGPESSGRVAI